MPLGSWFPFLSGTHFKPYPIKEPIRRVRRWVDDLTRHFLSHGHPVKGLLRLRVNGREFWLGKPGTRQADERRAAILAGPNVLLEIALFKIKAVIDDFV